ncbi:MAG: type IV conjugative transfer system protein TraL [Gammaproteobacteria bacterium]|nr:type IV conjugative transfer system protein TraL [Gammaproteobacteria bacterium]
MEPVRNPKLVDAPTQFWFWSADEILPVIVLFFFGMITHTLLLSTLVGIALAYIIQKYKDRHPDGYLLHVFYWWGITSSKGAVKNPLAREYWS